MPIHLPVFQRMADEVDMAEQRAARQGVPEIIWNTNAVNQLEEPEDPLDDVIHEENESDEESD